MSIIPRNKTEIMFIDTIKKAHKFLNDKFKLWVGFDSEHPARLATAVVTEVIPYPRHRILRIHTWATDTGYNFDEWYQPIVDQLEYYAKSIDCVALEAWCRKGLVRKLPDWEHLYSVISKPIEPEQPVKRKRRRRKPKTQNTGDN